MRDNLMGVEYESEEDDNDYESAEDYEDERGSSFAETPGFFARFTRGDRDDDRPAKPKKSKKKERAAAKEPVKSKRFSRDYDTDYDYDTPPRRSASTRRSTAADNLVDFKTDYDGSGNSPKIVIFKPETLEDSRPVCDNLKREVICVINLERVDKAVAQRIADFLSGACDALNGSISRISHDIFLIAPANIPITAQVKEELKSNGLILPWVQAQFK